MMASKEWNHQDNRGKVMVEHLSFLSPKGPARVIVFEYVIGKYECPNERVKTLWKKVESEIPNITEEQAYNYYMEFHAMGISEEQSKYIMWKLGMTTASGKIRSFHNSYARKIANEIL
jgi:hypothetical protein